MCRIEQFDVVYPNGTRERREQLTHCHQGTRSHSCRHAQVFNLPDRRASASDLRPAVQPEIVQIEPRDLESSGLHQSNRGKTRGRIGGVTLKFRFWNPFSSRDTKKKEKTQYWVERRTKKPGPPPANFQQQPRVQMHFRPPFREDPPTAAPIQPPNCSASHHSPERESRGRRRRHPPPPIIHHSTEEDEDDSPSPLGANREHSRRPQSLPPISRYEDRKERIRQRERQEREEREQERAQRVANREHRERQRERDEQRERQEQARILQERDDHERLQAAERERVRERQLHEERIRRRQEADRARQFREEQARRRQEEAHEQRRRAADRERLLRLRDEQARRQYAEERRYARARQANIPRLPRHPVDIHQDEGHFDRGERFIQNAIREEDLRQFNRRAGWRRGWYDGDDALQRRNTIDGGQRWYDGRRWRPDRR